MMKSVKLGALGLAALFIGVSQLGCGGSSGPGGGGNDLSTATFNVTTILPSVPGTTVLSRLSATGIAVGSTVLTGPSLRATQWTGTAGLDLLPRPTGHSESLAHDINASGVVVGRAINNLDGFPMRISGGVATVLDWTSIAAFGEARAINDAGVIAGTAKGTGTTGFFVRQLVGGALESEGPVDKPVVTSINASGLVIGKFTAPGNIGTGYIWDGSSLTQFLGNTDDVQPLDINASGLVVGRDGSDSATGSAFVRETNGTFTVLTLPTGYTNGWANCVTDDGVIGGFVADVGGANPRAVIWVNRVPILISPRGNQASGSVINYVQDINPDKTLLCTLNNGSAQYPCVLTPIY